MNSNFTKRLRYLFPLTLGIAANKWVLAQLLTDDKSIDGSLAKNIILALQLILILYGFMEYALYKGWLRHETRKIIFVNILITAIACFALGEIYLRLHPKDRDYAPDWYALLADFPDGKQLLEDRRHLAAVGGEKTMLKYYEYYLYSFAPTFRTNTTNFTDYYSSRYTPDSKSFDEAKLVVWMFGGSTTLNLETTDKFSIANQIAVNLNSFIPKKVVNLGSGSFQSSQESIKYFDMLRRVKPSERPDYAIFYDGFNETAHTFRFGAGNMQRDISEKIAHVVEGRYPQASFYAVANLVASKIRLLQPLADYAFGHLFTTDIKNYSTENMEKGVSIYIDNMRMMSAVSKEFNVRSLFVLQPLLAVKKGLTPFEEKIYNKNKPEEMKFASTFYQKLLASKLPSDFRNISDEFDNDHKTDFCDYGHTGPTSSLHTGKVIADLILKDLKDRRSPKLRR